MSLIDVLYGSEYIKNSLKSLDQTPEKSVQQMSKSLAASPLKKKPVRLPGRRTMLGNGPKRSKTLVGILSSSWHS